VTKSAAFRFLALSILALAIAGATRANDRDHHDRKWWDRHHDHDPGKPMKAPEIDLSLGAGALTLLVGGALIILGRRQET
jgi:hypothetical protein